MHDQISDIISLCKQHYFKDNRQVRRHIATALALCRDEEVLFAISAGYCTRGKRAMLSDAVVLVTNRQLLVAAHSGQIVSRPVVQSVAIDHIASVRVRKKLALAEVVLDIAGSDPLMIHCIPKQQVDSVSSELLHAIEQAKHSILGKKSTSADEILKYKYLLDMGAITQAEFAAKKLQLLSKK